MTTAFLLPVLHGNAKRVRLARSETLVHRLDGVECELWVIITVESGACVGRSAA